MTKNKFSVEELYSDLNARRKDLKKQRVKYDAEVIVKSHQLPEGVKDMRLCPPYEITIRIESNKITTSVPELIKKMGYKIEPTDNAKINRWIK